MTVQVFKAMLDKRPFQPVRLRTSSGESYEIRHPEMAFLTRSDILVGTHLRDGIPGQFKIVSLLHVTAIEPMESQAA